MANTIQIKRRTISSSNALGTLAVGELAVDLTDSNKLYVGSGSGNQLLNPSIGETLTSTGDFTIDSADGIVLDAGGDTISLKDDGLRFGILQNSSSNFVIQNPIDDKDILFKIKDGGTVKTALTLDGSANGNATLSGNLTLATSLSSASGDLELHREGSNRLTLSGSSVVVNDSGENIDFRVEGDGDANLIRTDASNDRVGIKTSAPAYTFHCVGTGYFSQSVTLSSGLTVGGNTAITGTLTATGATINSSGNGELTVSRTSGAAVLTQAQSTAGRIGTTTNHDLQLMTNSTVYARLTNDGRFGIGCDPACSLHVVNNNHVLFENTTSNANSLIKLKTTGRTWQMSVRESDLSGALTFRNETAGTDDLKISTTGTVTVRDNLTVAGSCTLAAISGTTATFSGTITGHGSIDLQDNDKLLLGAGNDLEIFHDGSHTRIKNSTGNLNIQANDFHLTDSSNTAVSFIVDHDGATGLYFNQSAKLTTTSTGVTIGSTISLKNSGNVSYIQDSQADLRIESNSMTLRSLSQENYITCALNGAVSLFHDSVKKFETTGAGTTTTGNYHQNTPGTASYATSGTPTANLTIDTTGSINSAYTSLHIGARGSSGTARGVNLTAVPDGDGNSNLAIATSSGYTVREVARFDKAGHLGIGTASLDANHSITIANTSNYGIRFTNTNATIKADYNLLHQSGHNIYLRPASGYWVNIDSGSGLYVGGSVSATNTITTTKTVDSGTGALIQLKHFRSSGATGFGDDLGTIDHIFKDSAGNEDVGVRMVASMGGSSGDNTHGSESTKFKIQTLKDSGTLTDSLVLYDQGVTLSGDVGIGVTPASVLHIKKPNSPPEIRLEHVNGGTQLAKITFDQTGNNKLVISTHYDNAANKIQLAPQNNIAATFLGSGNCGFGVVDPFYPLHLETTGTKLTHNLRLNKGSATGDYAEIAFQLWSGSTSGDNTFGGSGTSRPSVVLRALNENGSQAAGAFVIGTFTGGSTNSTLTEKLRLTSSGHLGLGISAPTTHYDHVLHVHDSNGNANIHLTNSTTGSAAGDGTDIIAYNSDTYFFNREAGHIHFGASNTTRMSLSPAGSFYPAASGASLGVANNRWNLSATSGNFNNSVSITGATSWAGNDTQTCGIYLNTADRGLYGNFANYARNLVKAASQYVEIGHNSALVYGQKFIVGSNAPNGFMFQSNIGGTLTTLMQIRGDTGATTLSGNLTLAGGSSSRFYFGAKRALEGQISSSLLDVGEDFGSTRMRSSTSVYPTNSITLGTSANRWSNVYSTAVNVEDDYTLTQHLLHLKGGGSSGAYGMLVETANGTDLFKIDTLSYKASFPSGYPVGIGTDTPTHKLSIFGTGAGNATVQIEGEGGADPYINFLVNNTTHWAVGADDSDSDSFKISQHSALGTNDRLTIASNGVTSLTTAGNTQVNNYYASLIINNTGSNTWSRLRFDRSGVEKWGVALGTDDTFRISNLFTSGTAANPDDNCFVITNSSNIGIGTSTPDSKLTISNTSGIVGMNIKAATNNVAYIDFGDSDDSNIGGINYDNSNDTLNLRAGNANRLTINSSGDIGIGVSPNTTYKLRVNGTTGTPLQVVSTNNNCNIVVGSSTQTQYSNLQLHDNGGNAQIWKAGTAYSAFGGANSLNIYASNGKIAFHPNGAANKVVIDTNGRLAIGSTSPAYQLHCVGTGYFSDSVTMASGLTVASNAAVNGYFQLAASATPTSSSSIGKLYAYNNAGAQLNYKDGYNTNHALHSASDYRLKENITDYSSDDAVSLVKAAQVKRFDYIEGSEAEENRTNRVGFLAHELQEAGCDLGAVVSLEKDAVDNLGNPRMQSVDYKSLVPVLWSCLQKVMAELDDAKERILDLENK